MQRCEVQVQLTQLEAIRLEALVQFERLRADLAGDGCQHWR